MMRLFYFFLGVVSAAASSGSFNSFREQVGFCKLQGFDTTSRSTSDGPLIHTNLIGVGLSHVQFQHNISNCGRCIRIEHIENFPTLNDELTEWSDEPAHLPITAIVMDECYDPVCQDGFLDFDIYNPKQPVARGNPSNIRWEFIDCPFATDDIELLFCFSNTCHAYDPVGRTTDEIIADADPYFWSLFIRKTPIPIMSVEIRTKHDNFALAAKEGWFYDGSFFDLEQPFIVSLTSAEWVHKMDVNIRSAQPSDTYRGGIIIRTSAQN